MDGFLIILGRHRGGCSCFRGVAEYKKREKMAGKPVRVC